MADTQYPVNHPLAIKLWRKKLFHEALTETHAYSFMGKGTDSLCQILDETSKGPGDRIRVGLRMQLSGAGVSGDGTLEGQEEELVTYTDDVTIDQLRHAVRSKGRASQQRVSFEVRDEAKMGLKDWWADRIDTWFFNQLAGNTAQSDVKYTGMQSTLAPSTTTGNARIIYGPDDETTENSISTASASNNFQLTMLDRAIALARTATPLIRPLKDGKFVCFLHPWQVYNLRTDATANRVTWYDTQKARVQGGEMDNGIYSGALGEYNGVILHQNNRIPAAGAVTTVRRAVFCGAQAAAFATGQDNGPSKMTWVEELFDYDNKLGVAAGMIGGLKKLQFNNIDFGTIVLASHAEAPA